MRETVPVEWTCEWIEPLTRSFRGRSAVHDGKRARAGMVPHAGPHDNLFGMTKRFHEHCPAVLKPQTKASNAKELSFGKLDSGYKVATAGSIQTGRSETIQYFHGSEVALAAQQLGLAIPRTLRRDLRQAHCF